MTHRGGKHAQNREAGFTLVELLVALSLFSLLSLVLFGSLRFGLRAWELGTAHADRVEEVMFAQNLLRRLVADAYPLFVFDDPLHPHVDFDGKARSLDFLASAPIALGGGGRSRFAFFLEQQDGRTNLVMTSKPELAHPANTSLRGKTLLIGVHSLEFSYFGRKRGDRVVQWHDDWTAQPALPQLLRIGIGFPQNDARVWPDLVIGPQIAVDVGCSYDPLTKYCRGR